MTREIEIKNKTNRLVFIPLNAEDHKTAEAFKKLCRQDELTIHDLLLESIQLVFVKHHLDLGGNPQLQLERFQQEKLVSVKCRCGRDASVKAVQVKSGKHFDFCESCFGRVPLRYDPAVWKHI
jgi:hypothetical protein